MSFYSYKNKGNERSPGLADFEALQCITERVCIQVNKVYDSCLQQDSMEDVEMVLNELQGTAPYTFISLRNSTPAGTIEDLTVTRLQDRPNFARIQANIIIPLTVNYSDSTGTEYVTPANFTVKKDVIMYVPDDSIMPYRIECNCGAVSVIGEISQPVGRNYTLTSDICMSVIMKVLAEVDLLVPAFGFAEIPPCEEYADEACDDFFALPLFPPQMEDVLSNNTALGSSFYNSQINANSNSQQQQ